MTSSGELSRDESRIAGSFRDPSGYVFWRDGAIYRAIDEECRQIIQGLFDSNLIPELVQDRTIVGTQFVENEELRQTLADEHPEFDHFLEHEVIPIITYPYEWSVSMLADAGIHTIDLQCRLLQSGHSLKDATAYNIQFVDSRPVFIDIPSIEQPSRLDLWFALGQFSQMFLFPLLLSRHCGWDLRSYFLANLGGRDAAQVVQGFGWLQRWRPSLVLDLTLPAVLTGWANKDQRMKRDILEKPKENTGPQILNLRRIQKKLRKLAAGYKTKGVWSQYTDICNYEEPAEAAKKQLIKEFLESTTPDRVLDLGCNTGEYSYLAAECGAKVMAVDSDHDAVELLYRRLRKDPSPITPLIIDLCNPSPGIGYMNCERTPFIGRARPDCVFALALIHHLLVSGNLSLENIRDMFFQLTERDLVLEFVPTDDSMFERLIKLRVNLFGDLSLDSCRKCFLESFELIKEEPIPESKRTLLFLRKRTVCP